MDKIFSVRMDESVIQQVNLLAKRLGSSKKNILEEAILFFAKKTDLDLNQDVFDLTCGAWNRPESAEKLVEISRTAFNNSMKRRHNEFPG